jgi:hypothetical protein
MEVLKSVKCGKIVITEINADNIEDFEDSS